MSRAWDKAKAGASWLAKAGAVVGAVVGAVTAGLIAAAVAPGAFGVIAAAALGGAVVTGAGYALQGALYGGAIGGVYGAVSDEPKEKVAVQQQASTKAAAQAQDMAQDGPASARFQTMVNESRAKSATAQR